ncbi:MAG TPA: right-handed parallel beta-helix repeat-containing protein [Chthoniobacteraceae bacterium]|nr:right-handed parallel beta-helix repeat-containing protein [Chthoniobacteraceae bacterium]
MIPFRLFNLLLPWSAAFLLMTLAFCAAEPTGHEIEGATVIHVSPQGDDHASGRREAPVASVKKALSLLPATGKGVIVLRGGLYREEVVLAATGAPEGLLLCASPGEEVVFDGSEPITRWEAVDDQPGLHRITVQPGKGANFNLWEPKSRFRYQQQPDAAGVAARPGSFFRLEKETLLVHSRDGRPLRGDTLRQSRAAVAITVERSKVILRGIHFRNDLGDRDAAAITIRPSRREVEIRDCTMSHMVNGIRIEARAEAVRIADCDLRDVGTGIVNLGFDTTIRDCVIQAARGDFAIEQEIGLYSRNGIRSYHPAQGATISGCVTAGFWAGLYIKTGLSVATGRDQARPWRIERNRFLDGIKRGEASQALHRYSGNVIAGGAAVFKNLEAVGAKMEGNYFIGSAGVPVAEISHGNLLGPPPFAGLEKGAVTFPPETPLPPSLKWAAAARNVEWTPEIAAFLDPAAVRPAPARAIEPPTVAASALGAVVTARFSTPGKGVLRYRENGETIWREIEGRDSTLSTPDTVNRLTHEPEEGSRPGSRHGVSFPLLGGELAAGTEYEWQVIYTTADGQRLEGEIGRLTATGAPKTLHLRAGAPSEGADGSREHPFPQLQPALDRTLPGDTLLLQKGVYTAPALLAHGGTAAHPITLRGEGEERSIVDGGREAAILLELRHASHVVVRDLQWRWFRKAGIAATDSRAVTITGCRFFNRSYASRETPDGYGILLKNTPGAGITHCLFTRTIYGVLALDSPQLQLRHNTAFGNLFSSANLVQSGRGSEITHNSFGFAGVASLIVRESDPEAFASMKCDFNNYGALLGRHPANREQLRPENDFQPAARYGRVASSKRIIDLVTDENRDRLRFYRMEDWRESSGKDRHSIYADPQYANPLEGDFRLLASTPNRLDAEGESPRLIGAAPVVETPPPVSTTP